MSQMMRTVLLSLLSLLLCLIMSSCWDRKEINDLALVTGVAIDKKDDKLIEVSVQIFIPQGSTQGDQAVGEASGGTGTTFVQSAHGENIADALSQLQQKFSRKIFWGHAEVFIFGEAKVKQGVKEDLDFLMRDSEPRERAFVFVSKGKAKKILEYHSILERNTSEVLREMANNKTSITSSLAHLSEMLEDDSKTALLPWVVPLPPPNQENPTQSIGYINGTAILHNGKLVGVADNRVTRGILWIINEMDNAIVTIQPEGASGTVSVKLLRNRSSMKPRFHNGQWEMTIHVSCKNQLLQNTSDINLTQSSESLQKIEDQLERNIEERISLAVTKAKNSYKADIFNFAGAFHRAYPRVWKQNQKDWDAIFPEIKVIVKAKAEILRPGMFNTQESK
ncbi:Ger(x)C family spore germination protein [Paenibacillus sp. FSL H8-0537]|uniref:Ger(x)C family spore germination protein n=1 Tax=Paenibacillus sp. FSL H8-0537 TaxID=2921399 RepID=UPI0031013E16